MEKKEPDTPRGHFKAVESYESEDRDAEYFPGSMNKVGWPLIKSTVLILIFIALKQHLSFPVTILICLAVIAFYQDIVAIMIGRIRVPAADNGTFLCSPPTHLNIMSSAEQDEPCVS